MKIHPLQMTACLALAHGVALRADAVDLQSGLVFYQDFEFTGAAGLLNLAPGATGFHSQRSAGGSFDSSTHPSGPGFPGMPAFNPGNGASDRSQLILGKALNLVDTRNDAITVPVAYSNLGPDFTIALWHALTPSGGSVARPFVFEGTDNYHISWGIASGDSYTAYVTQATSLPFGVLERGSWHHVAHVFTSDGTTTTLTLFINGKAAGTGSGTTASMGFSGIHFGKHRGSDHTRNWDGMFDDLAIWNRALSAREIEEIHLKGRHGFALPQSPADAGQAIIILNSADPTTGTVSGGGIHPLGTTIPITSSANPGFTVTEWSGPFAGQPAAFGWLVTGDVRATATFGPDLADNDGDGLTNHVEILTHGTNPNHPDTDGDGIPDGTEVKLTRSNPLHDDSDWIATVRSTLFAESAGVIEVATPDIWQTQNAARLALTFRTAGPGEQPQALIIDPANTTITHTPDGLDLEIRPPAHLPDHFVPRVERR